MTNKVRLTAICVLCIYCSLFLLANSPLHIYLFHRNVNSQAYDYSPTPFPSLIKSKGEQECPLCKFLNLTLFRDPAAICIILIAFLYLITAGRYKTLYIPISHSYYSLAPPTAMSTKVVTVSL